MPAMPETRSSAVVMSARWAWITGDTALLAPARMREANSSHRLPAAAMIR